jgi:transketolase
MPRRRYRLRRDPALRRNEVAEAWRVAMEQHHQPGAPALTRQGVPILDRSRSAALRRPRAAALAL